MKFEIEVVSKEIIKPSSPTPDHLHHYKLSFLDQISPPVYSPFLLFYPEDSEPKFSILEKYNQLRQSLSQALNYYYPLAGRIKGNQFVDCTDKGILYLQAKVSSKLSLVIGHKLPNEFKKLLPFEVDEAQEFPLGVQFNVFECGGICIGLCISHKIADALSTLIFLKNWAAITRGEANNIVLPEIKSASIFPPKNLSGFNPATGISKENVAAKRFVFSSSSIESLKQKYAIENQPPPSRVEALSVFIWRRFTAATKEKPSGNICSMLHAVNLRNRMDPPLPEHSFGNYYSVAITFPEEEKDDLVKKMRDSVNKIDKEYVKRLQEGNEHVEFMKERAERFMRGEIKALNFSSLCRFPLFEADFGWGKPVWGGATSITFKNIVVFMDAASGDGVEALIHLSEDDMSKFQEDEELLQFVSC